ncbi:hypothetical protein HLB23_28325 [Nocardia uniformis]|uniref:Uncharacterized protein n=1 Tax=Nocardia uniformis TaxID=53432 RepID=A0A849C4T8_9NOCA|nr:hypothetical protein [Nocardia uniformis]NNH73714.1 hypothetical protein [Nocardia uniformis]
MSDPIGEALGWLHQDLLAAQLVLAAAGLPAEVPYHVEVIEDILSDHEQRWSGEWKLTVARAVLAARDAAR